MRCYLNILKHLTSFKNTFGVIILAVIVSLSFGATSAQLQELCPRCVMLSLSNWLIIIRRRIVMANMSTPPHRVRMPCTLEVINHIIEIISNNKQPNFDDGCGLSLFSLFKYVTKTIEPTDDSHQFRSTEGLSF